MTAQVSLASGFGLAVGAALDRVASERLSVLIFHRVLAKPDPLFPEERWAAQFDALMRMVASAFTVVTVGQAQALLARGQLPARALAITFDDGYADNAEIALPILRRHGIAATFFVSTGFLDGGRMWNDSVIECVRRSRQERIDLSALGLGVRSLGDAASRRGLIDELLPKIKYLDLSGREQAIDALHAACGRPELPINLMMTSQQVRELHQAGMEIGGHTVNHPILQSVPPQQAREEIVNGRARLEDIVQAPVEVFAYPNGKPGRDYGPEHVALVRDAGFRCAVSTAHGTVRACSDVMQWPRFTPWNHSPAAWMARLLTARYRG
jgi:peptidoglycan/xylan/chitin deacetylase (PgdA/CDA1 family)